MVRRARTLRVIIAVLSALAGCGGGGGGGNESGQSQLPPDPGAGATSTVAGIDTNLNGVRDEVERRLSDLYRSDPAALSAAMKTARGLQHVLAVDPNDSPAANALFESNIKAAGCLLQSLGNDASKASEVAARVYVLTYNTPARLTHRIAVMRLVGPRTVTANSTLSYC